METELARLKILDSKVQYKNLLWKGINSSGRVGSSMFEDAWLSSKNYLGRLTEMHVVYLWAFFIFIIVLQKLIRDELLRPYGLTD